MFINRSKSGRLSRSEASWRWHKRRAYFIGLSIVIVLLVSMLLTKIAIDNLGLEEREIKLGMTFSKKYAAELGLDWRETYLAMLDDLGARALRLPVYWDEIESKPGEFSFTDVDWQLQEAGRRGVKVILVVGMKVPRWPECHFPAWTQDLTEDVLRGRVMVMLQKTVQHLSRSSNFANWQVENEPFFRFGNCPEPNRKFLQGEVDLVKSIDSRPVIITDAGELSDWVRAITIADILGISTYRNVWNRYVGHVFWPSTPKWYSTRIKIVQPLVEAVIISELQAEPWSPGPIRDWDIAEQLKHMNPQRLNDNVAFARRMGVFEVYLWGGEWWYWLKTQGYPEMWDAGKMLFDFSSEKP
ncbi:hypothetical protein KKF05_04835 [Patescibacteria group bacterium]|nr:hypothetical protein [Patescibacteria group bacterium]MBU1028648.1 hypothetical protein [Patescibacteria group bacterium]MBU1915931.1 hypothetical protein [Patescibacteria group bacterium]